jgi:hypothetical protein
MNASEKLAALDASMTKGVIGKGWSPDHDYSMDDLYGAAMLRNALPKLVALVAAMEAGLVPAVVPGPVSYDEIRSGELARYAALLVKLRAALASLNERLG